MDDAASNDLTASDPPSGTVGPASAGALPRRRVGLLAGLALVVYALDQVTKVLAVARLEPGVQQPFLGELLQFHLIRNPGAAFSLGTGSTVVFTVIQTAVVIAVLVVARRVRSTAWAVGLGLLLAGAAGNATDRYLRAPGVGRGHVVDFLELPHWPIFNLADSSVVAAAVLIAVLGFRGVGLDGRREQRAARTEASGA
ncbi:signal peptidase II [Kineococcus sp. R8]|uniref:signal peptidase II n=1 Tax=Kineococcus siccus TaxID=2696567 RepID=UPI0014128C86|nr:signal peptidase II [Kineococcus siccus]NAZ82418.1 signal peptidase II [Kineococcus siccus]